MRRFVLDTGALIALERRNRRVVAMIDELTRQSQPTYVPAGVVAQAWRGHPRQYMIRKMISARCVRVESMSEAVAWKIGGMLVGSDNNDVVDAHVALLAVELDATVLTSDPKDLLAFDSSLKVVTV